MFDVPKFKTSNVQHPNKISSRNMIVRARILLPISQPPIEDGAIKISGNRIEAVGRWRDLKSNGGEVFDCGDSIVLPGLINAHCHLDYTDMAGMISPPKSFSSWIKSLLAIKAAWSYSEYAQSWLNGAKMLLRTGTTTVADIEAVPELLPEVWSATPLRVHSLLELTNVKSRRNPAEIIFEATQKINSLQHSKCLAGLSPHALYSTSPDLLKQSARIAREKNWLVSTHVAESEEEFEMFEKNRGPLFDWLKTQRDMSDTGISPVEQLARLGMLSENFLAVHANYISKHDAGLLAKNHCSVVHCPRSHDFFGHKKFPWKMLCDAGVNICLGTDSLATTEKSEKKMELNLFSEMQTFAKNNSNIAPEEILKMATINAARAMNLCGKVGELSVGGFAHLIAIPFTRNSDLYESVAQNRSEPSSTMIDGLWVDKPALN
jgi:cytosine/adenosine deaminase-related metal-dependent hydrolase